METRIWIQTDQSHVSHAHKDGQFPHLARSYRRIIPMSCTHIKTDNFYVSRAVRFLPGHSTYMSSFAEHPSLATFAPSFRSFPFFLRSFPFFLRPFTAIRRFLLTNSTLNLSTLIDPSLHSSRLSTPFARLTNALQIQRAYRSTDL